MNFFEYKIYDTVYNDMISGEKTIEFRLLNEKTKSIKIGDEIKFKVLDDEEKYVLVSVLNKYIYDDIDDLWEHKEISNNLLNYTKEELVNAFYEIFGKEKVMNSKIVGIEFKVKKFN
jgi:ASC-1-like (ASCH) protein